jgi:beta-galactosidase
MYPSLEQLAQWLASSDRRPLVMCEYSHAMGTTNGSLHEYWQVFEAGTGVQGGFVWEWADHALRRDGRLVVGGGFDEPTHDATFCADGLVDADRRPHAGLVELAWLGRPVRVAAHPRPERAEKGWLVVRNERFHAGLEDLEAAWEVLADGEPIASGALDLPDVAPRGEVAVKVRRPRVPAGTSEAHLLVTVRQREATPWAPAGHVVGWDQVPLPVPSPARRRVPAPGAPPLVELGPTGIAGVTTGGASLVGAVDVTAWRAPTDNDGSLDGPAWQTGRRRDWHAWGLDRLETRWDEPQVEQRRSGRRVLATATLSSPTGAGAITWRREVRVDAAGRVRVDEDVTVPEAFPDVPRLGAVLEVADGLEEVRWFGLGPHECYPDRRASGVVAVHACTVDDLAEPLVHPQEHGLRMDVRWLRLAGAAGAVTVWSDPAGPFVHVRAGHHHDADLEAAALAADLPRRATTQVHVDGAVRGVGTGACGPDTRPGYRVGPGRYRWRWWLGVDAG